jgi:hypothetical protein
VQQAGHAERNAVNHFASYWQFFDRPAEPPTVTVWRIRARSRLADADKGDILWLFTSGGKCRKKLKEGKLPESPVEDTQAYLTEVFTISSVIPKVAGKFKLLVQGANDKCLSLHRAWPSADHHCTLWAENRARIARRRWPRTAVSAVHDGSHDNVSMHEDNTATLA